MKKETLIKTLAVVVVPGGIPVFLGYKAYQFGRWVYKKKKEDEQKEQDERRKEEGNK